MTYITHVGLHGTVTETQKGWIRAFISFLNKTSKKYGVIIGILCHPGSYHVLDQLIPLR